MRILALSLVSIFLGLGVGLTSSWREFAGITERFELEGDSQLRVASADTPLVPVAGARVEVLNGKDHDFGEMERHTKRSHKFFLKNVGTATLTFGKTWTSCSACTIAELSKTELKPGETSEALVEWTASSSEPEFHKEAYIHTSDPNQPTVRLVIHGNVTQLVLVEPRDINLGQISQNGEREGSVRVYSFSAADFALQEMTYHRQETAKFFEVKAEPLSAEELEKKPGAKHGFLVSATVKSGLPLGALDQTIRYSTGFAAVPKVEIPIQANVIGDISIMGGNYNDKNNVLSLGVVPRAEGRKTTVQLIVKGPYRQEVKFTVDSTDPPNSLKATLGEPTSINNGAVIRVPLEIEVPRNAALESRLGGADAMDYGRITLRTTHPTAREVSIKVHFAIEVEGRK